MKDETALLTAAVLSAGFLFSVEHVIYACVYIVLFFGSLLLDVTGRTSTVWSGWFLIIVASTHSIERFWWHVVLDRPFPEGNWRFLKKPD